jgi:hypothetical protein
MIAILITLTTGSRHDKLPILGFHIAARQLAHAVGVNFVRTPAYMALADETDEGAHECLGDTVLQLAFDRYGAAFTPDMCVTRPFLVTAIRAGEKDKPFTRSQILNCDDLLQTDQFSPPFRRVEPVNHVAVLGNQPRAAEGGVIGDDIQRRTF